jgi:hypothetical protein
LTRQSILFDLVIPGCALLGADPESSTEHCSGFRVRSPSDKIDFVNFARGSRPGMTVQWMRGSYSAKTRFALKPAHDAPWRLTVVQTCAGEAAIVYLQPMAETLSLSRALARIRQIAQVLGT